MPLARVQATGKVSGTTAASVIIPFASPPTVGNAITVAVAGAATSITFATTATCTDNYGNTYTRAVTVIQTTGLDTACAIYLCAALTTTGAGFAVTVTFNIAANYSACAIEVSSGGAGLVVDQTKTAINSGLTVSTGATPALTANEVFVVALWATWVTEVSITVQAVSPPWVEEYEQLTVNPAVGEADSRILTGVLGTTTSCSWTYTSTNGSWSTVLAAFKAGAALAAVETTQPFVWGPV